MTTRYSGILRSHFCQDSMDQLQQISPRVMIPPHVGARDEEEIQHRKAMLEQMTTHMFDAVEAQVVGKWQARLDRLPSCTHSRFSSHPPHFFVVSEYYPTVQAVMNQTIQAGTIDSRPTAHGNDSSATSLQEGFQVESQMHHSKTAHTTAIVDQTKSQPKETMLGMETFLNGTAYELKQENVIGDACMELVSCSMLLGTRTFTGRVSIEARVLHYDPEPSDVTPRWPSLTPTKRACFGDSNANIACNIFLADLTGPIMLTLWGRIVNDFYSKVTHTRNPFMFFEGLRVSDLPANKYWNGPSLSKIRMLHSITPMNNRPGTTLTVVETPRSYFLVKEAYAAPMPPACINEFSGLVGRCKAPFRVTLRGIITDVSDIQATVHEDIKRLFSLVDNAGSWIKCCAIGMPARSLALVNGNEVVLYFCSGRGSLGTSPGMVYLMKDSLIVKVGSRPEVPPKRFQIEVTQA